MKKTLYSEITYILGLVIMALGTALMTHADFGLSMIAAPPYILHLKISQTLSFFSFGFAEYVLQGTLLIIMCLILKKFKVTYLCTFITVLLYGVILDFILLFTANLPDTMAVRVICFFVGFAMTSFAVACYFKTYISPGVYELFVKELSARFGIKITVFKTWFDVAFLVAGLAFSFLFFGFGVFNGIGLGTVFCTLLNGWLIGKMSELIDKFFVLKDRFPLRKYFE